MSEYEQVIEEIAKRGVAVKANKIVDDNYIPYERKYVGCVVELDFSEHDKPFEDEIGKLKGQIVEYLHDINVLFDENKVLKQRIAELESGKSEKPAEINFNDQVKVKLTPLGVEIFYHQYDDLNKKIKENGGKTIDPSMPQIDKDGYTKFTLWHFMELYGEHIGMCKPNVVSPLYIELCPDEWKIRYDKEPIEKTEVNHGKSEN